MAEKYRAQGKSEKEIEKLEDKSISLNEQLIKVMDKIAEGDLLARSAHKEILASVESLADIKQNIGSLSAEKTVFAERRDKATSEIEILTRKLSEQMSESSIKSAELIALEKQANLIKEDIKDREIQMYRKYRKNLEQNMSISSNDMKMKSMLKKIDRKIDERLSASYR